MSDTLSAGSLKGTARYTWGGDEFLFVEISEAMSLAANFKSNSMATKLGGRALAGVTEICPANASLLVRFDPDVLGAADLETAVREIEVEVDNAAHPVLNTRLIEVPVWYDDPYTRETGARFRSGHQRPEGTDLDFAAEVNNLSGADEFIRRHHSSPWLVSMVGFVAGLPFMFQMVPREQQLEVPKYLSPRTDTPPLTVGHGQDHRQGHPSCRHQGRREDARPHGTRHERRDGRERWPESHPRRDERQGRGQQGPECRACAHVGRLCHQRAGPLAGRGPGRHRARHAGWVALRRQVELTPVAR